MIETKDYVETKTEQEFSTTFEPEFKPFSFGEAQPEDQTPEFEIEKQYNLDSNDLRELGEKAREMSFITLDKNQDISSSQEIVAKQEIVARPRLNARGKIIVSVYSIIVAIILAFCIYNAVSISSLSSSIAAKNQIVASQTEVINNLEQTYNSLGDEDVIRDEVNGTFKTPTQDDTVVVDDFVITERPQAESHTNWFEEFCRKLKNLFS